MAWMEEFIRENIERRTPNTEPAFAKLRRGRHRTSKTTKENVQRPMKRDAANAEHRTPNMAEDNAQRLTPNVQRPMRRYGANFEHRTSNIEHRMRECSCSCAFFLRGIDAGFENSNEFVCFFQAPWQIRRPLLVL